MWCSSSFPMERQRRQRRQRRNVWNFLYNGVGRRKVQQSLDCSDCLLLSLYSNWRYFAKVVSWIVSSHFTGSISFSLSLSLAFDWISNAMNYSQTKDILRGHRQDCTTWNDIRKCIKNCRDTPNKRILYVMNFKSNLKLIWNAMNYPRVGCLDAEIVQICYRYRFFTQPSYGVRMGFVWCLCFNIEW